MTKKNYNKPFYNILFLYITSLLAIAITLSIGWLIYRATHQHNLETKKEACIKYEAGAKQRLDGIAFKSDINKQIDDEVARCKAIYSD